jgi:class 3 adenylate cyclase/formylmethanofuran dehydrogenase subunit D
VITCPSCGEENPERARFCLACGQPLEVEAPAGEERKVVSVLFVDLVGFTSRSDRADPEDVRATLRPYHERVKADIERFGGTVEKFIGDAVMAVFGAPVAHEDDGERAVRSGLRILETIGELREEGLDIAVRAAVTTGEAVVALGARPERGEGLVTGDVVNTAARLQAAAPVGAVIVDGPTDVVFPASSFAEKDGTFTNTERRISRVRAAAELPGEARVDREIVIAMAKALGGDWPEYPDAESVWNELADLAPNWYGVRYDRLEENGIQWPVTEIGGPDTKFLHAPRPARPGGGKFFPVEYQEPIEQPDSEYPLVLSTGRTLYHYNSATMTMRESGITDKQEDPFFEISAEDASALGLEEGDWARLVSRRGDLRARALITDRVFPGLVWMALHFAEQKVNWLTHDVGDPLIGTPEFKVSAVRVEALGGAGLGAAAR